MKGIEVRKMRFKEKEIVAELKGEEFFQQPGEVISAKIGEYFI